MHSIIENYFAKHFEVFSALRSNDKFTSMLKDCAEMIIQCSKHKGKVLIAGNGGSAAQAQHLAAELVGRFKSKRRALSAFALSADSAVATSIGNDFGYEKVFSRQLEGVANECDLFIGFTTSGKSKNILEALYTCKLNNVPTIIFTGTADNNIDRLCDHVIRVPAEDTAIIQDFHHSFVHIVCEYIDKEISCDTTDVWSTLLEQDMSIYRYLLIDRDGVINRLKPNGYITSWNEFVFNPRFLECIKDISSIFEKIYIVSNQRGVGKGLMSKEDLDAIHKQMLDTIVCNGGRIDGIFVCTSVDSNDYRRKPNIGMAMDIKESFPKIDFTRAIMVGDSITDKLFADNIGAKFIGA